MELTIKSILDAITIELNKLFGDSYNIETGEVKQGFETPCFFVKCINGNDKYYRGKRYQRNLNFNIIGFSENNLETELYDMADKLYLLEYITLENKDLLRCINLTHRIEDGVLQFFFDIECFIYKENTDDDTENMESMSVEIN